MTVSQAERTRACLLGGAVGDALGWPIEFWPLSQIEQRYSKGYRAAPFLGAITDDTQMTLFTAEGILRSRVAGQTSPLWATRAAYARWYRTQTEPCPDSFEPDDGWLLQHRALWSPRAPGNTCMSALSMAGHSPARAENNSKGCGGVMRVAPVGLAYAQPFETAAQVAELTHGHPTSSVASGAFAQLIALLAREQTPLPAAVDAVIASAARHEHGQETADNLKLARNHAALGRGRGIPEPLAPGLNGGGWIAEEALAIAVFCCLAEPDPIDALYRAVEHDGDSDSTGAIAGNILGAWLGAGWIRAEWLEKLELRDVIEQVAKDLLEPAVTADLAGRYPV
jgi:ADP-ribosylglycohydrolase